MTPTTTQTSTAGRGRRGRRAQRLCVVLVRPQGPVNVGLACRALANLGVTDLRVVAPDCRLDAVEARKFAHHAQAVLTGAQTFATLAEAVADCTRVVATSARRRRRGTVPSWTLAQAREAVAAVGVGRGRFALVFGNERHGLDAADVAACEAVVHLSAPGPYPSYNLSHAVVVTLYALLGEADAGRPAAARADQKQLDGLQRAWLVALDEAGYFRRTTRARFAPKLHRLLLRLPLTPHDVNSLRGMFAHLQRALGRR